MMIYLVIALICGLIGSLIGRPKGYPVWGFFMGLIFTLPGLIAVALWRPSRFAHRGYVPKDPWQPKDSA